MTNCGAGRARGAHPTDAAFILQKILLREGRKKSPVYFGLWPNPPMIQDVLEVES